MENSSIFRTSGDEWLYEGPRLYIPHPYVVEVKVIEAIIVPVNTVLKLRCVCSFVDREAKSRDLGDEWALVGPGAFLLAPQEELLETIDPVLLSETQGVHIRALNNFIDRFGIERKVYGIFQEFS